MALTFEEIPILVPPQSRQAEGTVGIVPQPDAGQRHKRYQAEGQECRRNASSPGPFDASFPERRAAGADRAVGQVSAQVVGQLLRAGVTLFRLLLEALQADRLQVA